jgi:hypothetical protein
MYTTDLVLHLRLGGGERKERRACVRRRYAVRGARCSSRTYRGQRENGQSRDGHVERSGRAAPAVAPALLNMRSSHLQF